MSADCLPVTERVLPKSCGDTQPACQQCDLPFITVIVPVRNEALHLEQTLQPLLGSHYPVDHYEILIVDGRSTDATRAIAENLAMRYPFVRALDNPRQLSSAARNIGIAHARGEIVVIIDGHCQIAGPEHLAEIARAFERSGADCLGRPQPLNTSNSSPLQRSIAAARSSWLGHHPDSFIYCDREQFVPAKSVAVAYRKSVFDRVGLFDERFDACEDVELNHRIDRAGLRCYFAPSIAVRYKPRASLTALYLQMARYGRGRVRLLRKHPETFSVGSFAPAAFVAGLALGPLAALAWQPLGLVYLVAVVVYLTIVLGVSLVLGARAGAQWTLGCLLLVFLAVHFGSGTGMLLELAAPWRRRPDEVQPDSTEAYA